MARYKIDCCQKDCPNRNGECHGTFEKYKLQRKELDETMEAEKKKGAVQRGLNQQYSDSLTKMNKRLNRNGW